MFWGCFIGFLSPPRAPHRPQPTLAGHQHPAPSTPPSAAPRGGAHGNPTAPSASPLPSSATASHQAPHGAPKAPRSPPPAPPIPQNSSAQRGRRVGGGEEAPRPASSTETGWGGISEEGDPRWKPPQTQRGAPLRAGPGRTHLRAGGGAGGRRDAARAGGRREGRHLGVFMAAPRGHVMRPPLPEAGGGAHAYRARAYRAHACRAQAYRARAYVSRTYISRTYGSSTYNSRAGAPSQPPPPSPPHTTHTEGAPRGALPVAPGAPPVVTTAP